MDPRETDALFGRLRCTNNILDTTGGIPWKISRWLKANSEEDYLLSERQAIRASKCKLQLQYSHSASHANDFKISVIPTLLRQETTLSLYDKKYFIRVGGCKAVVPLGRRSLHGIILGSSYVVLG